MTGDEARQLLEALARETGDEDAELVETHISWVLLVGDEALKIKKPVDLGFVDFSTLERRRHFCEEELRLNSRLAPHLYLAVVAIGGTPDAPVFDDPESPPFEYAVRMRRFPQDSLLANVLVRGELTGEHVDDFARRMAEFHATAARTEPDSEFGTPDRVWKPVADNFESLFDGRVDSTRRDQLERLHEWSSREFARLGPRFVERKRDGFVRECHGDAHLGNAILERRDDGDRVVLFDGIDFAPELRWIDVVSDAAFAEMDLADRGRRDLANRFLSTYCEWTGDYGGLELVPFYVVYRALVRAKVAAIRRSQPDVDEDAQRSLDTELDEYLALAEASTQPRPRFVLLTCGLSGSGKSTLGQRVVELAGAVRVRSDVERKRLFGLEPNGTGPADVLYSPQATVDTYARLRALARVVLAAGFPVVVDATFLQGDRRSEFRELAGELGVPFVIAHATAQADVLKDRIRERARAGGDASDADVAVLEQQLASAELPERQEADTLVRVDTSKPTGIDDLEAAVRQLTSPPHGTEMNG